MRSRARVVRSRACVAALLFLGAAPLRAQETPPPVPPTWVKAPAPADEGQPAPEAAGAPAPGAATPTPAAEAPAPASAVATAGDATLTVRVDPSARVGDVLAWEVVVDAPEGTAVAEPQVETSAVSGRPGAGAAAPMELREPFRPVREETAGGRTVRTFRATVAPFETGSVKVPGAELLLRGPTGETRVQLPQVATVVGSVLPAGPTPALKAAKGIVRIGGPLTRALLAAIVGALVALLAVYLWKRRKVILPARPGEPPIPFDERALRDLKALAASPLLREGRVAEYYVRLSAIVRAYLGARYGFDALEMTTGELLRGLRKVHAPGNVRDLADEVTRAADMVKFARHEPAAAVHAEALAAAFRMVEVSRPAALRGPEERAGTSPGPPSSGAAPATGSAR